MWYNRLAATLSQLRLPFVEYCHFLRYPNRCRTQGKVTVWLSVLRIHADYFYVRLFGLESLEMVPANAKWSIALLSGQQMRIWELGTCSKMLSTAATVDFPVPGGASATTISSRRWMTRSKIPNYFSLRASFFSEIGATALYRRAPLSPNGIQRDAAAPPVSLKRLPQTAHIFRGTLSPNHSWPHLSKW